LLSLFFLGGSVIHDFAFALIVGVLVGTYSSVFIASALVIYWRKYKGIGS
jgi:preprotein translocase subunit SecF